MKTLIYCVLAWVVFPGILLGEEIKLDRELKEPEWKEVLENPENSAAKLKALLDQGKLYEFYEEADRFINKLQEDRAKQPRRERPNPSEEEMENKSWVLYYIAVAPFVSLESPEDAKWCFKTRQLDYSSKFFAFGWINPSLNSSKKREAFYDLHSVYYAKILRSFRKEIDPEFREKEKELRGQLAQIRRDENRDVEIFNMGTFINVWAKRKKLAQNRAESLEERFVRKIIRYYPSKAFEARKYIKLAGYEEKEIDDLLNRTVGRTPESEFLYKGRAKLPTRKEMR